jgi:CRISPR/Cas system endoribonuclease Cas6 (RAMP superfamily)
MCIISYKIYKLDKHSDAVEAYSMNFDPTFIKNIRLNLLQQYIHTYGGYIKIPAQTAVFTIYTRRQTNVFSMLQFHCYKSKFQRGWKAVHNNIKYEKMLKVEIENAESGDRKC